MYLAMKPFLAIVAALLFVLPAVGQTVSNQLKNSSRPTTIPKSTVQVNAFVGCYALHVSRWWPWGFGEDDVFVKPPKRIQLSSDPDVRGSDKGALLIRTIPISEKTLSERRESSFWFVKSAKRALLTWTNGFSGVSITAKMSDRGFSGWAHPHFDFPTPPPRTAHVTAHRVPCGPPPSY